METELNMKQYHTTVTKLICNQNHRLKYRTKKKLHA